MKSLEREGEVAGTGIKAGEVKGQIDRVASSILTLAEELPYLTLGDYKLNRHNHGEPQCLDISKNDEVAIEGKPQAWSIETRDGIYWLYNYEGARKEAEYLGMEMPTQEQWIEMIESEDKILYSSGAMTPRSAREIAQLLNIPRLGYRAEDGTQIMCGASADLWCTDTESEDGWADSLYLFDGEVIEEDIREYFNKCSKTIGLPIRFFWKDPNSMQQEGI